MIMPGLKSVIIMFIIIISYIIFLIIPTSLINLKTGRKLEEDGKDNPKKTE